MSTEGPSHPAVLTEECWAQLVSPLRRYYPKGAEEGQERDFREQVAEIVTLLSVTEADAAEWVPRMVKRVRAVLQHAPPGDRLVPTLIRTLPYITSTREQEPPLPVAAKKRLLEVYGLAAALYDAISAALADPWLDSEYLSEALATALVTARRPPADSDLLSSPEVIEMVRLELLLNGVAPLGSILEILGAAHEMLPNVAKVAAIGAEWIEGLDGRGRPYEAPARIPALFLAAVTRQYAPSPPPRGGIEDWRTAIVAFVCGVLAETGLSPVNREFLRRIL